MCPHAAMSSQQTRRERVSSDRAQAIPAGGMQRPGMGSRTSSAPAGGFYKLDVGRRPSSSSAKARHTLVEEDEGSSGTSHDTPKRSRSRHRGNEEPSKLSLPEVTIAVVGEDNAGKTSFIKCALDMRGAPSSVPTRKKMSLDGAVYIVRLLEIDLKQVSLDRDNNIRWPRVGKDSAAPIIDGVLLLHDATQPDKLEKNEPLADALHASPVPFLLVACKCDRQPENSQLGSIHERHEIYRTSPDLPRSQQMCIALVLRSVIARRADLAAASDRGPDPSPPPPQPQHPPSAPPPPRTTTKSFQPISPRDWHHTRAISETYSAVQPGAAGGSATSVADRSVDGNGDHRLPTDPSHPSNLAQQHVSSSSRNARSNSQPVRPQTPPTGARLNPRRPSAQGENSPIRDHTRQRLQPAWRHSGGSDTFNSFLNMDDEMEEGGQPASPSAVVRPKPSSESNASAESGLSFDELVDRLVALPMSKQDSKFTAIFLCLYRKFAAPSTLLNALISRFEKNETSNADQLARMADQLRLLNVIASWASEYPGDFANPKTKKRINEFVSTLEKSHFYMFAAKEIGSYLDSNAEDDDIGWAFGDGAADEPSLTETFFNTSGRSSPAPFLTGIYDDEEDEEEEDPIYSMSGLDLGEGPHDSTSRLSGTLSISSNADKPSSTLNQSFTLVTVEAAQKEALRLEMTGRTSLSKIQWRFFMETSDEEFARELTRIDWIMYNSFRPRDLVRHVSLSGVDKDKIKSLQNVNRMIRQFNHVAFFVASMILLRDKPKHRARCLEKFMNIAVKLRRQNNYNALGSVIAAINGTPVHRLTQTRELIPVASQKEFMRLVILMSTQKSHFAYRLAWDNSFSERIPFLPLHRRDLVSAEEGNKTFVGENKSRINWKKFEVMGEVVLGIQRSQKSPHPQAQKFDDIERLILDSKLSGDEEDLYARSLQVEPSTGGETGRRKFGWLPYHVIRFCHPPLRISSGNPKTKRSISILSKQHTPESRQSKMTQSLASQARSTYRALLRELPRQKLSTPSPLHQRLRSVFRAEEQMPSTPFAPVPSHPSTVAASSSTTPSTFSIPSSPEEQAIRLQEAEQLAQYARAQRTYNELLKRYNSGWDMEEEERIRLTARRVGFNLPHLHVPEGGRVQRRSNGAFKIRAPALLLQQRAGDIFDWHESALSGNPDIGGMEHRPVGSYALSVAPA
ncbi:uncharacterized protein N7482_008205 [Penicillium canariense]|uniref:Uncharacterized protein n=1 Tax=Penicillium canariense TaxID=189055 RepID=A0A9W9LIS1_9EURO|nr:uncharacterized protein N7482_008205 [Penicillium canariense]KAJ5157105.1 hypothetical protein N7482_008205 [Penicillium canariense]